MMLSTFALVGALLAAPPGALLVEVSPRDAIVEVDGKTVKAKKVLKVAPGSHKVKARRLGYRTVTKQVQVTQNKRTTVRLILSKNTGSGGTTVKKKTKTISAGPNAIRKKTVTKTLTKNQGKKKTVKTTTVRTTRKTPNTITKGPVKSTPSRGRLSSNPKIKNTSPTLRKSPKRTVRRIKTVKKSPVKRNPKPKLVKSRKTRVSAPAPAPVEDEYDDGYADGGGVSGGRGRGSMRPLAGLLILAGGVAVTGGVLVGMSVQEKVDEFDESVRRSEKRDLKEEAESRAMFANVLYGVGATGLLLGSLMWSAESGPHAAVSPLPGGGYVSVKGTF